MSKICKQCKAEVENQVKFCTTCGSAEFEREIVTQGKSNKRIDEIPEKNSKYAMVSTWEFLGAMLLMCVPVLGWILLIVWALGGTRKINKRNFARASVILIVIGLLVSFAIGLVAKVVVTKVMEENGIRISETGGFEFDEDSEIGQMLEGFTGNELQELMDMMEDLKELNGGEEINSEQLQQMMESLRNSQ
ncbi:MAG: hypothetical protein IJO78_06580 [Erysipelotrichaceae bacterium]|nr:hypothetical protein [Erysipelotrichaceae bacterium]